MQNNIEAFLTENLIKIQLPPILFGYPDECSIVSLLLWKCKKCGIPREIAKMIYQYMDLPYTKVLKEHFTEIDRRIFYAMSHSNDLSTTYNLIDKLHNGYHMDWILPFHTWWNREYAFINSYYRNQYQMAYLKEITDMLMEMFVNAWKKDPRRKKIELDISEKEPWKYIMTICWLPSKQIRSIIKKRRNY